MHGGPRVFVPTVPHSCGVSADRTLTEVDPTCREHWGLLSHFPGKTGEHPGQGPRGLRGRSPARSESAPYSEPGRNTSANDGGLMETREGCAAAGALWPGVVRASARTRLPGGPSLPGLAGGFPTGKPLPKRGLSG